MTLPLALEPLLPLPEAMPPRLLCSLADAAGEDVALALLLGPDDGRPRLLAPTDAAGVVTLRLGAVTVDEAWRTQAV